MELKSQMLQDVDNIFFNLKEFTQEILYNGSVIEAIVDFNMNLNYAGSDVYEAVQITIKTKDINKPIFGDVVSIDSQLYLVESVVEGDSYIWILDCRRNESVRFRS